MPIASNVSRLGLRAALFVLVGLVVLGVALSPAASFAAAGVPAVQPPSATPGSAAAGGCAQALGHFADLAALGFTSTPGKALAGPVCKVEASDSKSCVPGVNCHRYCACECSRIKDCNVDSDCSNHRCLSGISCC